MRRRDLFKAGAVVLAAAAPPAHAFDPGMPVYGLIFDRNNMPVPGLTVRLRNDQIGYSIPVLTGPTGNFYLEGIPRYVNAPYILEVWWGPQLVFQTYVTALGQQQPIRLP